MRSSWLFCSTKSGRNLLELKDKKNGKRCVHFKGHRIKKENFNCKSGILNELKQTKKKISKKGKKNRAMLENECGKVSAITLVTYMEKKKTDLRKLKRSHYRKQKQEESKVLNGRFQADPGSVYSSFNEMIKEEKDNTRPKYTTPQCTTEGSGGKCLKTSIRRVHTGNHCGNRQVRTEAPLEYHG